MGGVLFSKTITAGIYKFKITKKGIEVERLNKKATGPNIIEIKPKPHVKEFYLMFVSYSLVVREHKGSYVEYE